MGITFLFVLYLLGARGLLSSAQFENEDNLFLELESELISEIYIVYNKKATLPCRITDPHFEKSFKKSDSDVNEDLYTFDPKLGVIIDSPDDYFFKGNFTCSSKGKDKYFLLNIVLYRQTQLCSTAVSNGTVVTSSCSRQPGSVCNFTCDSGFTPAAGVKSVICGSDGNWTFTSAVCVAATVKCPTSISNGQLTLCAGNVGDLCNFTCSAGYTSANGVYSLTCGSDGHWTPKEACVKIKPRISYDNDTANQLLNGSLVLRKRDNLILKCSGYDHVEWVIEQEEAKIVGPDFQASGLYSINITADSENTTLLGFEIEYNYTGKYICRITSMPQLNDSIYVFVSDEDNPFLEFTRQLVIIYNDHFKEIILPCRTTDPRFEMSFKNVLYNADEERYTFDPKVGVIIDYSIFFYCTLYACSSKGKDKYVYVSYDSWFRIFDMKPSSHIVLIGESFHITCIARSYGKDYIVIEWSYISNKTGENTNLTALAMVESTRIRIVGSEIDESGDYTARIDVQNATMTDGGVYRCTFIAKRHTSFEETVVRVIDKTFVTLIPLKTEYITKEGSNKTVMEVKFDAYPKPTFEWYKDNTLISTPNSGSVGEDTVYYDIKEDRVQYDDIEEDRVQYAIKFPKRTHAGNYTLKAYTTEQNASTTMKLTVEYTPVVKVNSSTDEFYLLHTNYNLTCMAESVPPPDEIDWYWQPCENLTTCRWSPNAWQKINRSDSPTHSDRRRRSAKLFSKIIDDHSPWNISVLSWDAQQAGWIKCLASNTVGNNSDIINFVVTDIPNGFSFNVSKTPSVIGDNITLICKGSLWKFTSFEIWNKTKAPSTRVSDGKRTRITTNSDNLTTEIQALISPVTEYDRGLYECVISRTGQPTVRKETTIEVANSPTAPESMEKNIIIGISVFSVGLIAGIIVIGFMYRKRSEERFKELEQYLLQTKGDYNPEIPIDEQTSSIAYDPKWEFPKERLTLGKVLGQGAFGRVVKAVATEIVKHEDVTCVAVKMVKDCTDREQMMSLLSELKIFIHIGQHLNVLRLLGAVTKKIARGELYVILEYCHFGNLRNYLIKNKDSYKDIMSDHFDHGTEQQREEELDKAKQMSYYVNKAKPDNTNDPVGPPLTKKNLILWAFEVGRGMEYLASKKYIHRDLAARNVLLAEHNVLKICDFGLSKDCYKYVNQEYHAKGDGPMPIMWTALESLTHKICTTKSDVWSYGVFLWELFALGGSPYPGVEFNEKFITLLKDGYRLEKPEAASDEIYEVMRSCWAENPNDRPTFSHLVDKFGDFLEYNVRQYYLDLGESNLEMNDMEPDSDTGHEDPLMQAGYLKMNSASGDNTSYTKMAYAQQPPDGAFGLSSSSNNEDKDGYVIVPTYETKENGDNIELHPHMSTTIADEQAQMHENRERCGKYLRQNSYLLIRTPVEVHRDDNDSASGHSSNATGSSLEKLDGNNQGFGMI